MRKATIQFAMILVLFGLFTVAFAQTNGGPDAFGYIWRNSNDANGPDYNWITPPGGLDVQPEFSDDSVIGPYDIGFNFPYYNSVYDQVWLSSNGFFTFVANTNSDLSNNDIPDPTEPNSLVAWFWDDLDPADNPNGDTHCYLDNVTVDGANAFVMTFENYHEYPGNGAGFLTAQVILKANGDIIMQYEELNGIDELGSTVGIENEDGTDGLAYQYNVDNIDNAMSIEFVRPIPVDNDLQALSIAGPTGPSEGTTATYSIAVLNRGLLAQDTYTVKLMQEGDVEIASTAGTMLNPNETATFDLAWTPTTTGATYLWGEVVLAGDEDTTNNETSQLDVVVQPSGTMAVYVGNPNTTTSDTEYPINVYWWHSLTQVMYYPAELNGAAGQIMQIKYYNNFTEQVTDKPTTIWMAETDQADLSGGWLPYENFTEVWTGNMAFPMGQNEVTVSLATPFVYGGGNLVVMVEKNDTQYDSSSNQWYYTDTPEYPNRAIEYHADGDANNPDPANPPNGTNNSLVPNTTFMINTAGMGSLAGTITDQDNAAAPGVLVELDGFPATATSIADGTYNFPFVTEGTYEVTATKHGYYDAVIQNVVITADQQTTLDIQITQLPNVTVTGHVIMSDTGNDAVGATVSLEGYEDYLDFTTDGNGNFTIPGVYADQTYLMTVEFEGYQTLEMNVDVGNTDLDLGDVVVEEIAFPASNVIADLNYPNVDLTWNTPGAGVVEEFRYDDGTATAQLGFGANPNAVMGPAFFHDMQVQEVTWLLTSNATHTEAIIFIFGLDETGFPDDSQVLHQSDPQPNVDDQWNTYTLPEPVDAPNGCVVGVCTPGVFTAIGTDDGVGEPWVFSEGTMWGIADWTAGTNSWLDVGPAGFPFNFTLRAYGYDYGPVRSYYGHRRPVDPEAYVNSGLNGFPLKQAITPGAPVWNTDNAMTRLNLAQRNESIDTRLLEGYNVYRLNLGDEDDPSLWTMLANVPEPDTVYTDTAWAGLPDGLYKYAVRTQYTNNVEAPPAFSNWLSHGNYGSLTVNVGTNVGSIPEGAEVHIESQDPDPDGNYPEYLELVDNTGVAYFDEVWIGMYDITVQMEGFEPFQGTVNVDGDVTFDCQINELSVPPSHVTADQAPNGNSVDLMWWNPQGSGEWFNDFEGDDGEFVSNATNGWQWGAGNQGSQSGANVWGTVLQGNYENSADWQLVTPPVMVYADYVLTFYHLYDTEGYWDGGNIKVSLDGTTWDLITPEGGYPEDAASTANAGISGEPCYSDGPTGWTQATFLLEDYEGEEVMFKFHFGSDGSVNSYPGWFIDDVRLGLPEMRPDRPLLGFNVYRFLMEDEDDETQWTQVATNVADTVYTDNSWSTVASGIYEYGVKAVYTGDIESDAAISNWVAKDFYGSVQVNVTTNIGDVPVGAEVSLECQDADPDGNFPEYEDVTGNDGTINFPMVWMGTYELTVQLPNYDVAIIENLVVDGAETVDVELTEQTNPPTNVTATIISNGSEVEVEWSSPGGGGAATEFRYDDGTATAQLGFGANPNAVMGPAFFHDMTVEEVTWLLTSNATHTEAIIFVFGLDETGFPDDSQVLHQSDPQPNVDDQWNTYTLPEPVEAPNGCVVGVCTPGVFTAIGTDDGVGEPWIFSEGTMWGIADWTAGTNSWLDVGPAGFPYNFTLRAYGQDFGEVRYDEPSAPRVQPIAGELNAGTPLRQPITASVPVFNGNNAGTREIASRALRTDRLEDYSVYRLVDGQQDNPGSWDFVETTVDTVVVDDDWSAQPQDVYVYAVLANYFGGNQSDPAFSNTVANNMTVPVTVQVTTDGGASPSGAMVTLTHADGNPDHVYTGTVPPNGVLEFNVWLGTYTITATLAGYEPYQTTQNIMTQTTINIELVELLNPISNLQWEIDNVDHIVHLWWDEPGTGGGEDSFYSGFEGTDFSDWGEYIQGPGTPGETGNAYWYIEPAPMTPFEGQAARADWGYNIDTALITPPVNITADTEISFAWFSSYYWSVDPNDNSDLFVKVSADGGNTWDTLWTYGEIGVWENFTWYETVLADELAPYVGQSVLVNWNLVGNDNSENVLDECYVGAATGRAAGTRPIMNYGNVSSIAREYPVNLVRGKSLENRPFEPANRELLGYKVVRTQGGDDTILEELWASTEYFDSNLPGGIVTYTVYAVYSGGESEGVTTDPIDTGEDAGEGDIPTYTTELGGNYPNPFNPETKIGFSLANTEHVVIDIYNVRGQKVRTLVNGAMDAGNHEIVWSGTDDNGKPVTSGMYFFKMKAGRYTSTKKMILLK